jgi:hypothetical protein
MAADTDLQRKLGYLGQGGQPSTGDFLFQSLMGGIGTGASLYLQKNQMQNMFQGMFPGQTPQFGPGQPITDPFSGFG